MLTLSTNWIGLSRPFSHHPLNYAQYADSFVPCRWHILQGGLDIWGAKECSFRRRRIRERILLVYMQIFNGNCWPSKEVSVIQLHLAPPTTVSRVNWTTMNCMKWRKRSQLCNLALRRGRLAIGNGEGQENFPRECWHHVRPLILFLNCVARVTISVPWPNSIIIIIILCSLLRY